MRTTRSFTAVLTVLISALVGTGMVTAQTAPPRTQSASAPLASGGRVAATITYRPKSYYDTNLHLSITRAGQPLYSASVTAPQCGYECSVATKAVYVRDLTETGEPVVALDLYTGGAHCCTLTEFFSYDATTQTYSEHEHNWGDPGYALKRLGGKLVFQTADDRFAYLFTDYAASGLPLQLLRFDGTHLVNVTRQYPALIAKDAASYLAAYKSEAKAGYTDSVGVIAAYAADEAELGRSNQVTSFLTAEAAAGHLNSAEPGTASGARFVRRLNAFLKRTGYVK